jgi:hypothetical protein
MRTFLTLIFLAALLPGVAFGQVPTGAKLVQEAEARKAPLGQKAPEIYNKLVKQDFKKNVDTSNSWIRSQVEYFDKKADTSTKAALAHMTNGGGEHGLGMRQWLTDPQNVAWWDNTVRKTVGDEGYARIVALNAAFPPGSRDYILTYGYDRKYDPASDVMALNEATTPGIMKSGARFNFPAGVKTEDTFVQLVKFGDPVRKQMFRFYQDYAAGKVTPDQVRKFNSAYVKAGGCAMAATEEQQMPRALRYLNALNLMAMTMDDLGYKVE